VGREDLRATPADCSREERETRAREESAREMALVGLARRLGEAPRAVRSLGPFFLAVSPPPKRRRFGGFDHSFFFYQATALIFGDRGQQLYLDKAFTCSGKLNGLGVVRSIVAVESYPHVNTIFIFICMYEFYL